MSRKLLKIDNQGQGNATPLLRTLIATERKLKIIIRLERNKNKIREIIWVRVCHPSDKRLFYLLELYNTGKRMILAIFI